MATNLYMDVTFRSFDSRGRALQISLRFPAVSQFCSTSLDISISVKTFSPTMTENYFFINNGYTHAAKALHYDKRACETSHPEHFDAAKGSYFRAIEYYFMALKYEKNENVRKSLRQSVSEYIDRAEVMLNWLKENKKRERESKKNVQRTARTGGSPVVGCRTSATTAARCGDEDDSVPEDDEQQRMQAQLKSVVLSEKPDIKWTDVVGLERAKDSLKEAVILPQRFPQMFVGKRQPWRGILLYGPPGTGKSHLAKALAAEADAKFFSVSSSDLMSKWQGESEKMVRELFAMARSAEKAIIFIDEIDALVSSRSESESESSRRIKNEFLVQMEGVGKSSSGVLLLGATNIPWCLDEALLRRMERRVYIPLPDVMSRARMFQVHIGATPHSLRKADFKKLADMTRGYSGSDIAIVVRDAIMQPVRTLQNATHFKYVAGKEGGKGRRRRVTPCSPGDRDGHEMRWTDIVPDDLLAPTVKMFDFQLAIANSKPSVSKESIAMHEKFTTEKGLSGV